jgi:hypothetical protein
MFTARINATSINGTLIIIIAFYYSIDTFTPNAFFGGTFAVIITLNLRMFTTVGILTPIIGTGISIITNDRGLSTTSIRITVIIETFA